MVMRKTIKIARTMQTEINGTFNSMKYSSLNFCKLTKRTEFSEINKFKGRLKPRPNDRNMPTQHVATLLGATCCVRLATVLRCVATCWVLLAQIWPLSNLSQQHPATPSLRKTNKYAFFTNLAAVSIYRNISKMILKCLHFQIRFSVILAWDV